MKKKLISFLTLCLIGTSLAGCSGPAEGSENSNTTSGESAGEKVTVVLDWVPNTNHTGMYVALENGYYKDLGLDVEIMQPPEGGALALVASDKAQFAVSFQEEIGPALTAENPLPVVAVASIIDHNVSGILSLKEKGIDSPSKLEGMNYASWDTPFEKSILTSIIEKDGGDYSKVKMIPNTVTDVISALKTDIDAVWVYYGWDGIAAELAGLETNYIPFREIDETFDFYTPVLAAGTNYLENNEQQAKKFLEATAKGYEYAIANPEEAAQILVKHAPEIDLALAKASQAFLANEYQAEKAAWGTIDEVRWSNFYKWMYEQELIREDLGSAGFTNDYLPK